MKRTLLLFVFSSMWAQPDSWALNPADYEHQMSVVAIIAGSETPHHSEDILGAFNEQEECVGLASSTTIPFGSYEGEESFLIQIYSNSFSGGEIISFKFYSSSAGEVFLIENTIDFIQDGIVGSVLSPLLLSLTGPEDPPTDPEEEPLYVDENNDGYDDASYAAGRESADINNDGLVDEFPIISIVDGNAMVLMQGSLDQYTDSGATCFDQEDEDLSFQVEVSGQIVNMNNPGTYTVFYNCSDSEGNAAQTQHRIVFVIPPTIADENEDGFDDDGFIAGAQSGDINGDGSLNVADIVEYISIILNQ